jgi:hypothetical protein
MQSGLKGGLQEEADLYFIFDLKNTFLLYLIYLSVFGKWAWCGKVHLQLIQY